MALWPIYTDSLLGCVEIEGAGIGVFTVRVAAFDVTEPPEFETIHLYWHCFPPSDEDVDIVRLEDVAPDISVQLPLLPPSSSSMIGSSMIYSSPLLLLPLS